MRVSAVLTAVLMIGLLCLSGSRPEQNCALTIKLTDAQSGRELPGLLKVTGADGKPVAVGGLLSRGLGLPAGLPVNHWSVLPKSMTVNLPRQKFTVAAISGLETELATKSIDLTGKSKARLTIPLNQFYSASERGYRSANTHLHLMKITREQCDRYLREIPKCDGLDVLFLSYLERAIEDKRYTSNRYTAKDLAELTKRSGVVFGNGEEHRHNFAGFGQGYGHVMLLNIKKLILPVSIGPGIMKTGNDGLPLRRGINTAHRDGATVLWCHNEWGMESLPNWVTGNIDAQNIFDGGIRSSYKDSFYRYLNAGLRVPFSTGTDWFMYDFSRVYVPVNGSLTPESWLKALAAGKSFITNGPLLEFQVAGKNVGETVRLKRPGSVQVIGRAVGRVDFERIELIHNSKVVATAKTKPVGGHFQADLKLSLDFSSPAWVALRTPPQSVKQDPELQKKTPLNELGRELFSHTSPIYVSVAGKRFFDKAVAQQLLAEIQANQKIIRKQGKFADEQALARVLDVHRDGIAVLQKRLEQE